ncbi:Multidrug resistance protein fnx1 [Lachnellula suecica]|uniref:Multidrug resistance protein fnx1 n=1 Tax=Lachnellula suecica TaxID=602035 RepID=A0A8T9CL46_9HELO|nr:Multidrug resistance protein fnx1 [Lachnellula suecica]
MVDSNRPTEQSSLLDSHVESENEIDHINRPSGDETDELSNWALMAIFAGVYLGAFVVALDSTLVATLSAPISTSFNNMPLLGWLASAFFIANVASQPLAGKLTDIYGRRSGFIFANIIFAIGNLVCAFASREWVLIVGRVVAGIGGGAIPPIGAFIMSDLVPLRSRGMWQGIGNICFGVGSGLGGPFGGWINDTINWRWAFVLQIPITVAAVIIVAWIVKIPTRETQRSKIKRVDWLGASLLVSSLTLLLLGLNAGGNMLQWKSPLVLVALLLSAVLLLLFVIVEARYAVEPILPVHFLLARTAASVCLVNWFMSMARFGLLFYAPMYFQVLGYSATESGLRLIPESVAICVTSISCGLIMRTTGRYYLLSVFMQVVFISGLASVSTLSLGTPAWAPFIYLFVAGMGFSGMITTTVIALIASVEQEHQAVITSTSYAFRGTGSVLGITIASAVFQNVLKPQLRARLDGVPDAANLISRIEKNLEIIHKLPASLQNEVSKAYMTAFRAVFLTLLGFAVVGMIAGSFMKEHVLHKKLSRRPSN